MGNVAASLEQARQLVALYARRLKVLEELKAVDDEIDAHLHDGLASSSHGKATKVAASGDKRAAGGSSR